MTTLHFHQSTASTPEQFIGGLTDFGPGRSKLVGTITVERPHQTRGDGAHVGAALGGALRRR